MKGLLRHQGLGWIFIADFAEEMPVLSLHGLKIFSKRKNLHAPLLIIKNEPGQAPIPVKLFGPSGLQDEILVKKSLQIV
ncbi:hypothetical protein D4L85_12570 [Chryseolinea soli]|uniref:Uncharacterized protein n=1 Tax=Chryseolinea soli TaxID=2321403 RepID=A0A385SLY1_9BACT|nr:hypothetical protein D4L85_12570 [Chryseolinea soli]